jgi:hypothetical protein
MTGGSSSLYTSGDWPAPCAEKKKKNGQPTGRVCLLNGMGAVFGILPYLEHVLVDGEAVSPCLGNKGNGKVRDGTESLDHLCLYPPAELPLRQLAGIPSRRAVG